MKIRASILFSLALASFAAGQGTVVQRYYIRARSDAAGQTISHQELLLQVSTAAIDQDERTGIQEDIFYPRFGFNAVAAVLTVEQVARLNQNTVLVLPDVVLRPAGGPPLGGSWTLNQWTKPTVAECGQAPPVVYVVDTGIMPGHADFSYPPAAPTLTFQPGMSYGDDVSALPYTPLPPYVDPNDHGTRVTGCLGGKTGGVLEALGVTAQVKSVLIYDAPAGGGGLATFVSKAISGVLAAAADHEARKATPYMKNHASVLVFASSTTVASGRFADLDAALQVAWETGLHVVISAGNEGQPAVLVSPAGAAWGYISGGGPTRFWFGAPPGGASFFRARDEFIIAGGYEQTGGGGLALWPLSNTNTTFAAPIDVFAPAASVPTPSSAGAGVYTTGNGTSYSAAYAAAMASWVAWHRPWATTTQVRDAVKSAATLGSGWPKLETPDVLPEQLPYAEWIEHFYPAALSAAADRAPLADPDHDGVPNLIEYYCGLDPRFDDRALAPTIELKPAVGTTDVTVRLPKGCHLGSSPQVKWELQSTSDCVTWTPVGTGPLVKILPVTAAGDGEIHESFTSVPPGLPGPQFYRLRFFATGPL